MNWREGKPGLLVVTAVLMVVLVMAVVSVIGFTETRQALSAARVAEAQAAAHAVGHDLDRVVSYGIPLDRVEGMADYLAQRVARARGIRFLAVAGADGRRLYGVGLDGERLDRVLAALPAANDPQTPSVAVGEFLLVRMALRDGAGAVVAGVEPAQIIAGLQREIWASAPFWLGCALLAAIWALIIGRAALTEPAGRLGEVLAQGQAGYFERLLVRRARDPVGRCLLAFNAVAAGLHARRQAFAAQADEVAGAVFDPAVAEQVTATRDAVLAELGDGLASPPARTFDPRGGDLDLVASLAIPAGLITIADALEVSPDHMSLIAATAAIALLLGLAAGSVPPRRGWALLITALLAVVSLAAMALGDLASWHAAVLATVGGWTVSWSAGVAIRRHRRYDAAPAMGWLVPVGGSVLAGAAIAWTLIDAPVTTGAGSALLSVLAVAIAAGAGHGHGSSHGHED
jgi:hypothetical protein